MRAFEEVMKEMTWNVRSINYHYAVYEPILGVVAKRCGHFKELKE